MARQGEQSVAASQMGEPYCSPLSLSQRYNMHYVKSVTRYNAFCKHYQAELKRNIEGGPKNGFPEPIPNYYCRPVWNTPHDGSVKEVSWGSCPKGMNREELINTLMSIDCNEDIEITTGHY